MRKPALLTLTIFVIGLLQVNAQKKPDTVKVNGYTFTNIQTVPHTPVKDQHRSGTCWSFAGTSFVEAEVMRQGGPELDLAEMWAVRDAYEKRADNYIKLHGKYNFGGGGEPHQVMNTIAERGILPEEAYDGLTIDEDLPVHNEMDHVLEAFIEAISDNKNRKLTPVWFDAYNGILDAYLGEMPTEFEYGGKSYTPTSFADKVLKINPNDYVEITSYSHQNYYSKFMLKIPDNWDYEMYYNVPMFEMLKIIDRAIRKGYSIAWAADVSDKGFNHKKGLALIPEKKWEDMEKEERDSVFITPVKQREITTEMRQKAYNDYTCTDDHSMHIIGTATDQDGNIWYKVKNSWASDSNDFGGYFYASKSYILYKTIAIYVHRDLLPQGIHDR